MFKRIFKDDVSLHSGIPKCYSHIKNKQFKDWEIPPWEILIDSNKLLGEGSWAKVYLAEWRHTTVVAKVLKNSFDEHAKQLIIKELDNMTKMHHPNIVQLFGYVEEPFVIVMEYFQNGDLFDNLHKLKLNQKIKIANDIIKGLIYIHERRPLGLIHRDIKLRNILLTNSYTAKIADFGLSTFSIKKFIKIASNNNLLNLEKVSEHSERPSHSNHLFEFDTEINNTLGKFNNIDEFMRKYSDNYQFNKPISTNNDNLSKEIFEEILTDESNDLTTEVGTVRYMAPEIKSCKYNNSVDIYSCGILLYELFTNNIYLDSFNWNKNLPKQFIKLIDKMTDKNPENRIKASLVLTEFQNIDFSKSSVVNLRTFRLRF